LIFQRGDRPDAVTENLMKRSAEKTPIREEKIDLAEEKRKVFFCLGKNWPN